MTGVSKGREACKYSVKPAGWAQRSKNCGAAAKALALVPTMGALHAGHIALIEAARLRADKVAATIFVNPLQFGANEDLDSYPRQEATDVTMLAGGGLRLAVAADRGGDVSRGFRDQCQRVGGQRALGRRGAAGPFRRGRDGGRQAAAQRSARCRFVRRKGFPAIGGDPADGRRPWAGRRKSSECRRCAIDDGLALSSRNAYLSTEERQSALALPRGLQDGAAARSSTGKPVAATLVRCRRRRF